MRILLMGPPGAGKGTQAAAISGRFGVPAISTGDIFRANVAAGTELGVLAQRYMEAGEYVPDVVTNGLVALRLSEEDCRDGFLLDGYPRTLDQVGELDAVLDAMGAALDAVVLLQAEPVVLVERLLLRASVAGRADDTEEVIRRRLELYDAETAPLAQAYGRRGLLCEVDGVGSVDEVLERVLTALAQRSQAANPG